MRAWAGASSTAPERTTPYVTGGSIRPERAHVTWPSGSMTESPTSEHPSHSKRTSAPIWALTAGTLSQSSGPEAESQATVAARVATTNVSRENSAARRGIVFRLRYESDERREG